MNTPYPYGIHNNGHSSTDQDAHTATSQTRPLMLLRHRPGEIPESARVVHLASRPDEGPSTTAVPALCGDLLDPEQVEQVNAGEEGTPCPGCALNHATSISPQAGLVAAGVLYHQWGWPVLLRRDQLLLPLAGTAVALLMPAGLADRVTPILRQRHCPPLLLAHPATPDHRVLLAGEPYPVRLGWPAGVHRITTQILLPPTGTPHGSLSWVHPPQPDALRLTREFDICDAIHTALRNPPPGTPTAM